MKPPERIKRCTTHFHACDCREWRFAQMERALKMIHVWCGIDIKPEYQDRMPETLELIKLTSIEALKEVQSDDD